MDTIDWNEGNDENVEWCITESDRNELYLGIPAMLSEEILCHGGYVAAFPLSKSECNWVALFIPRWCKKKTTLVPLFEWELSILYLNCSMFLSYRAKLFIWVILLWGKGKIRNKYIALCIQWKNIYFSLNWSFTATMPKC